MIQVLVSDDTYNQYGVGPTLAEAQADYDKSLVDYEAWLREDPAALVDYLAEHLRLFDQGFKAETRVTMYELPAE